MIPPFKLPEKGPWPVAAVLVVLGFAALVVFRGYAFRGQVHGVMWELAPATMTREGVSVRQR